MYDSIKFIQLSPFVCSQEMEEIIRQQGEIEILMDSRKYFPAFTAVLSHLQRIWELVLTAQVCMCSFVRI